MLLQQNLDPYCYFVEGIENVFQFYWAVSESCFWELIIEITQSLSINEYWGQELFTHFCIKFSSKPFEGYGIVHLGICLLFLLASIHLEGFGIQQGLHFPEKLILLPYFFVFQAWTISLAGNFKCLAFLQRSPADK